MIARILFLMLIWPSVLGAQGFAGLGTSAEGFATPSPDRALVFPQDHAAHPPYRIEWWYLTATLTGADGQDYGVQWTLFRSAMKPEDGEGWATPQLWMGHAGLTSANRHHHAERLGRGGVGSAGVDTDPFRAFIDDWEMRSVATKGDPFDALNLSARGRDFSYDLDLTAKGPLVLQGKAGYSVKSAEGQASYYYSQPFYEVSGVIVLPTGPVEVTGQGWLDREWSSQPLSENQTGWDWFSLSFADGARMMGFGLRSTDSSHFTSATWIRPDGTTTPYGDGALRLKPLEETEVAGRMIPVRWRVQLPQEGLDVTTSPLNPQSWMGTSFPYWEGPIRFDGSHTGRGYLEMTGYPRE